MHSGYACVRLLEAIASAVWLQQIFHSPELLVRMRNVIAFVLLPAGVSLAGAAVATLLTWTSQGIGEFTQLQLWWVSEYLGVLLFAPPVLNASAPGRAAVDLRAACNLGKRRCN